MPLRVPKASNRREKKYPHLDYVYVLAGTLLMALAIQLFLRPLGLAPGGAVGASILVERASGARAEWILWGINGFALLLAGIALGLKVVKRTVIGSALLPLLVWGLDRLPAGTDDPLLAAICGGAMLGLGIGLQFRGNGSPGGFGLFALFAKQRWGVPVQKSFLFLDASVLLASVVYLPLENVFAAGVACLLIARVSHLVLSGLDTSKVALIISTRPEEIRRAVLGELGLGLTSLRGQGGFSGESREMLMVVMRPAEVHRLKCMVADCDPEAFMVLSDASEVLGHGFKTPV